MAQLVDLLGQYRHSDSKEEKRVLRRKLTLKRKQGLKTLDVIELFKNINFNDTNESSILLRLIVNNYIKQYSENKKSQDLVSLYKAISKVTLENDQPYLDDFFVNFSLALPEELREGIESEHFDFIFAKESARLDRYMHLTDRVDLLANQQKTKYTEITPLAKAMLDRDYQTFDLLVQSEINLNTPFPSTSSQMLQDRTPLQVAIELNDKHMIWSLLNSGKDLNVNYVSPKSTEDPESALSLAILRGNNDVTDALLAMSNINILNPNHKPFINAITVRNYETASRLIDLGERLPSASMNNLLQKSVIANDFETTQFLLENGAKPNSIIMKQAFEVAINNKDNRIIQLLYKHGGTLNSEEIRKYRKTLRSYIQTEEWTYVQFLLSLSPSHTNLQEHHGTVSQVTSKSSAFHSAMLKTILKKATEVDDNDRLNQIIADLGDKISKDRLTTLLIDHISDQNTKEVEILLENIKLKYDQNLTSQIMNFAFNKDYEMVKVLHQKGFRLVDSEIWEMFKEAIGASKVRTFASRSYNENVLKYVITYASDYNIPEDLILRNILIQGIKTGNLVHDVNILKDTGISSEKIFSIAANLKNTAILKKLIEEGVPLEISRDSGFSALVNAINSGDDELVEWLLNSGVDPKINQSEVLLKAIQTGNPNSNVVNLLLDMMDVKDVLPQVLTPFQAVDAYNMTGEIEYFAIGVSILAKIIGNEQFEVFRGFLEDNPDAPIDELKLKIYEAISATLKPEQLAAFDILHHRYILKRNETESSMEDSLLRQANKHFENTVEPQLRDRFLSYPGNNDLERVEVIERDIKAYILDVICKNCATEKNESNDYLIKFITDNRAKLLDGDEAAMSEMRKLTTSNTDTAQIAWRGYDPQAPHDPKFPNLLTQTSDQRQIFTTHASSSEQLSVTNASDIVRKRVAYYFLAKPNETAFISQLADMRKAHVHTLDSPTCFPGAIGRIARMGDGHPMLNMPPTRLEVMQKHVNAFIVKGFSDYLDTISPENLDKFYYSLAMLTEANAKDVLNDKSDFDESLLELRNQFHSYLKSLDFETLTMIKQIDDELESIGEDPINPEEIALEIEFALTDLSGQGRSNDLHDRLQNKRKQYAPTSDDYEASDSILPSVDSGKGKEKEQEIHNPFKIKIQSLLSGTLPAAILNKQLESNIKKYIEFEIVKDIIYREIPKNDPESAQSIAESFANEIFALDVTNPHEMIKTAFAKTKEEKAQEWRLLDLSDRFEHEVLSKLNLQSSFNGLGKKQVTTFQDKLMNEFSRNAKLSEPLEKVMTDLRKLKGSKRQLPLQLSRSAEQTVAVKSKAPQEEQLPTSPTPTRRDRHT